MAGECRRCYAKRLVGEGDSGLQCAEGEGKRLLGSGAGQCSLAPVEVAACSLNLEFCVHRLNQAGEGHEVGAGLAKAHCEVGAGAGAAAGDEGGHFGGHAGEG